MMSGPLYWYANTVPFKVHLPAHTPHHAATTVTAPHVHQSNLGMYSLQLAVHLDLHDSGNAFHSTSDKAIGRQRRNNNIAISNGPLSR